MYKFDLYNTETRFIKNLLLNTYLPTFPVVSVGDFIVAGAHYTFGNEVIKCTTSGVLVDDNSTVFDGITYVHRRDTWGFLDGKMTAACSDIILCGPDLLCGVGLVRATYKVVTRFYPHKQIPGVTSNYCSHNESYDSMTHQQLGKYIRWYKSSSGIDLMPLYNCFTNTETDKIHLTQSGVKNGSNVNYTVWLVPAQVNKTYQIYLNSPGNVLVRGVYMNNFGRIFQSKSEDSGYVDELLEQYVTNVHGVTYKTPITYKSFTTNPRLVDFSNNFYLAIQVPKSHSGSVAVLESDTTNSNVNLIVNSEVFIGRDDKVWPNIHYEWFTAPVNSSLATISTKYSIPYSDRLLEYLLCNIIDSQEDIPQNIRRIQEKLNLLDRDGIDEDRWHPIMTALLYGKHFSTKNNYGVKTDILGFYDKDIENTLYGYEGV